MDHLSQLVLFALVALALAISGQSARAATYEVGMYPSAEFACNSAALAHGDSYGTIIGSNCYGYNDEQGNHYHTYTMNIPCDAGDQYIGGGLCEDFAPLRDGSPGCTSGSATSFASGRVNTTQVCQSGCLVTVGSGSGDPVANRWNYSGTVTGQTCTGSLPAEGPAPQNSPRCATGECLSSFNGVFLCTPCGTAGTTPATLETATTVENDGSKTTTVKQTVTNPNGSQTTTITTSATNSNGTPGATTTSTANTQARGLNPLTEFCAANPSSLVCPQAATAQSTLGGQIMSGADPQAGALPTPSNATVIDIQNRIDRSAWVSGASCVPDVAVDVPVFGSFTLPFSQACPVFDWLGYATVACALILAARIIGVWG